MPKSNEQVLESTNAALARSAQVLETVQRRTGEIDRQIARSHAELASTHAVIHAVDRPRAPARPRQNDIALRTLPPSADEDPPPAAPTPG